MGEVIPFDQRTEAERQLASALRSELEAQKAYEVAIDRVAYWTGQVAAERQLHIVETEQVVYADPIHRIQDLDRVWDDGTV